MMDTHGRRENPACITKAKFKALRNTDLPPPIGATPRSIQAACSDELGAKGMSLPSWVRKRSEPSFHGEAERCGNMPSASSSGAAVMGAGLAGMSAGTVEESPSRGSPMALVSSAMRCRKIPCACGSGVVWQEAHVQKVIRKRMQHTPAKSSARRPSTALLKRLLSELENARMADNNGLMPMCSPPGSNKKDTLYGMRSCRRDSTRKNS